ncbi:MAG: hypothetical protein AAGN46_17060 [Acidobacteriota bacterium]
MPTELPPRRAQETADEAESRRKSALVGVQGAILGITLALLVVLILLPIVGPRRSVEPLEVVLAPVRVSTTGAFSVERRAELTTAAEDALERHLVGRERLVVDAFPDAPADASAAELASHQQADETLRLELRCSPTRCGGALSRVRADSALMSRRNDVSFSIDDLRAVDTELADQVELVYLRHPRDPKAPKLYATEADYRRYLEIRRRLRDGADPEALARLAARVREDSPRFSDAYLLEARLLLQAAAEREARSEPVPGAAANVEAELTPRALLERARRIAPGDPRPDALLAALDAPIPSDGAPLAESWAPPEVETLPR